MFKVKDIYEWHILTKILILRSSFPVLLRLSITVIPSKRISYKQP